MINQHPAGFKLEEKKWWMVCINVALRTVMLLSFQITFKRSEKMVL